MRDYYEELWERLPERLEPPDLTLRGRYARANLRPGERVLDLGCGDGALSGVLAAAVGVGGEDGAGGEETVWAGRDGVRGEDGVGGEDGVAGARGSVVGADVAEAALRRARRTHPGLRFVRVESGGELPFEDGSFDVVWASEVIEHVADTARWLSEVRRVLVPRGRLLVTTPSHGRLRLALGGIERYSEPLGDHLHLYSARSLRGLLVDFGFGEVEVRAVGGPPLLRRLLLARAIR